MSDRYDSAEVRSLEACEMEAWADWYRAAGDASRETCSPGLRTVAGAILTHAAPDVLAFNRVVGLGLRQPAAESDIEEIVDAYAAAETSRFFVQVAPGAAPPDLGRLLERKGFRHYNNWIKLCRDGSDPPDVASDLTIRPIGASEAAGFGAIAVECFGWPETVRPWVGDTVGREGWSHYMAFDGDIPVATGAFFATGQCAWLDFAATLPEHRGRGAQSGLLARRIRDAAVLGCRTMVVETAQQTSERESPSWRNTLGFGFRQAYARPNYIRVIDD